MNNAVRQAILYRPLCVFAIGYAIGISFAAGVQRTDIVWLAIACAGIAGLLAAGKRPGFAVVCLGVVGLGLGAVRFDAFTTLSRNDIGRVAQDRRIATVFGTVASEPEQLPGRTTCTVQANKVQFGADQADVSGYVYATVLDVALDNPGPDGGHSSRRLQYGDVVTLRGELENPHGRRNPGAFSWPQYLARRGIYSTLSVKRASAVSIAEAGSGNPALRAAAAARSRILDTIQAALPTGQAILLQGILFGQRASLPPDLTQDFVTGTMHILATAGLHVGILIACLWVLFNRLTLPRKWSVGFLIGTLISYAFISGGRPSVSRAVIMAVIYFGAILFEREPDAPTALAAAGLLLLILQPTSLLEPGFQMSFLTVITLAIGMPVWNAYAGIWIDRLSPPTLTNTSGLPTLAGRVRGVYFTRALMRVSQLAGLSLLAQIGALPLVAFAYNEVSGIGVFANLIVVPMLFAVIPAGLTGSVLGSIFRPLGLPFFWLASPFLIAIEKLVRWLGQWHPGHTASVSPSMLEIVAYYAAVWTILWLVGRRAAQTG